MTSLGERYLAEPLSPEVRATLAAAAADPTATDPLERAFRLMGEAGFRAADLTPGMAWKLVNVVPRMLPTQWEGTAPPLTHPNRHARIDEYLSGNPWRGLEAGGSVLEVGCGYPPLGAVELACRFPLADVVAMDPIVAWDLVQDPDGDLAFFDTEGSLRYYQPGKATVGRWNALWRSPAATRERFGRVFDALVEDLPPGDTGAARAVRPGTGALTRRPCGGYRRGNLTFLAGYIGDPTPGGLDVVRCMNVLCLLDPEWRARTLAWAAGALNDGGLLLLGADSIDSREARYSVHVKEGDALVLRELAFGLDNLRPLDVGPWFVSHDGNVEAELLAELVGSIRRDTAFTPGFDARLDGLLAEHGLCVRDRRGYLREAGGGSPMRQRAGWIAVERALRDEGFAEAAVDALRRDGRDAFVNCVGHVGVRPPT